MERYSFDQMEGENLWRLHKYTKEDIIRIVEEEDIRFIRLPVYRYFRRVQKHGHHAQPAGKGAEQ